MKLITLEVCANSAQSCIEAQRGGAHRVELCAGIPEGGTTPSYAEIKTARKAVDIELNVIIRPRGGDFLYSPLEVETMAEDIRIAKSLGADGVVFGCLRPDGTIDTSLCERLLKGCDGLSTTFHRAFDVCHNPLTALEEIISLGFDRILTSGAKPTALEGKELIRTLTERAEGRIKIMAGSGVNPTNIRELYDYTATREFHSSARHEIPSAMQYQNPELTFGDSLMVCSPDIVRELISKITI
ncbi:MAG: copper homeostasis protein CutC [Rikenellaceae bacterium]